MAKADAVEAQPSVPIADELMGYAGRGVGISWSPPLEREHSLGSGDWAYQYALSTSEDPTCMYNVSLSG
jgi:hypothetical protein